MTVRITIFYHGRQHIFKNLIDELKCKKPTNIRKHMFGIDLELNVNSFDEIICILEKYSKIEIELSICTINEIEVYISCRNESCLENQVE